MLCAYCCLHNYLYLHIGFLGFFVLDEKAAVADELVESDDNQAMN